MRPKIVVLCGSSKLKDMFDEANYKETMAGNIVLTICPGITEADRPMARRMHREKIDLADEVVVVHENRFFGVDTLAEVEYAAGRGKPTRLYPE